MWFQSYSPKQKYPKSFQCDHLLSHILYSLKPSHVQSGSQVYLGYVGPPFIGKMPNKHSQIRTQCVFCQNIVAVFVVKPTTY